ncbi:MAG: hypothetical protein IJ740_13460, partial [Ruminococcus sp.]|nr:hypothetical protein [Ruminococcus sp.]
YDSEKNYISAARLTTVSTSVTTPENCAFVRFSAYINLIFDYFGKVEIINEENIPPYGYVLPLTVSGGGESVETPLYIGGEPLEKGEYADSESGKIYRLAGPQDPPAPFPQLPTFEGSTTFSCSCAPGPERAEISYKTLKKAYISADDKVYQDPNGELLGG